MKETMTRRQRVLAAINHQELDRIPMDLGVHFSTGISAFAYKHLREYLGLDASTIEVPDPIQVLARVEPDILTRFHSDTMLLNPPYKKPARWNPRGDYSFIVSETAMPMEKPNGDWIVQRGADAMRLPNGGYFFDGTFVPPQEYATEDEELAAYAKRAEYIFKETDYFTMMMGFPGFFPDIELGCTMITDPDEAIAQQEATLKWAMARLKKVVSMYGQYIQSIEINSDLGTQFAPYISPDMYETFCLPYVKQLCDFVHENSDIKTFIHCCGSVEPLIPLLIEAGIDALNPVQISAANMDPATLKERYGGKICFWGGGCDTQTVLPTATPAEVDAHVRKQVNIFKPGGGFVFTAVHNIMGDVPPENIVAMYDAAFEESWY